MSKSRKKTNMTWWIILGVVIIIALSFWFANSQQSVFSSEKYTVNTKALGVIEISSPSYFASQAFIGPSKANAGETVSYTVGVTAGSFLHDGKSEYTKEEYRGKTPIAYYVTISKGGVVVDEFVVPESKLTISGSYASMRLTFDAPRDAGNYEIKAQLRCAGSITCGHERDSLEVREIDCPQNSEEFYKSITGGDIYRMLTYSESTCKETTKYKTVCDDSYHVQGFDENTQIAIKTYELSCEVDTSNCPIRGLKGNVKTINNGVMHMIYDKCTNNPISYVYRCDDAYHVSGLDDDWQITEELSSELSASEESALCVSDGSEGNDGGGSDIDPDIYDPDYCTEDVIVECTTKFIVTQKCVDGLLIDTGLSCESEGDTPVVDEDSDSGTPSGQLVFDKEAQEFINNYGYWILGVFVASLFIILLIVYLRRRQ